MSTGFPRPPGRAASSRLTVRPAAVGLLLAGLAGVLLSACDLLGPDAEHGPGSFAVELVSPNGDEAAAVLEFAGGVDLGPVSVTGGQAFFEDHGGTSRVVIVMDDPGRVEFSLGTGNVAKIPRATVIEVADGANQLRGSVEGYEVELRKVKGKKGWGGEEVP